MDVESQNSIKPVISRTNPGFRECCVKTVKENAKYNPMMVCPECKYLIKCFSDDAAYRNYLKFCHSRGRHVESGWLEPYQVAIFKAFDQYR